MSFRPTAALALVVMTAAALPAAAAEEWHARAALTWTDTALSYRSLNDDASTTRVIGDDSAGFSLGLERRLSDRIGVELALDASRPEVRLTVEAPGVNPISAGARMDLWTLRAGLNLHLLDDGPIDLYLGPTVAWVYTPGSIVFRAEVGDQTESVRITADNGFGWGGTAGADVDLGGGWTLGASYTYLKSELDFADEEDPEKVTLDLDPSTIRFGIGVRF